MSTVCIPKQVLRICVPACARVWIIRVVLNVALLRDLVFLFRLYAKMQSMHSNTNALSLACINVRSDDVWYHKHL